MATKQETMAMAAEGQGCLGKAADDEEVFVLRGNDLLAPVTIELWTSMLMDRLTHPAGKQRDKIIAKAKSALGVADRMRAWQSKNNRRKLPD